MTDQAREIVEQLVKAENPSQWPKDLFQRLHVMAREHPGEVKRFCMMCLDELPGGGTYYDAILSFLPDSDWQDVIDFALKKLDQRNDNEAACETIAYASLQCPQLLHPHLEQLFDLDVNSCTYYAAWPWRESGTKNFAFLKQKFEEWAEFKLLEAMLETRDATVLEYVVSLDSDDEDLERLWNEVGISRTDSGYKHLFNESCWHIVFPEGYLPDEWAPHLVRAHPTWSATTDSQIQESRFGGTLPGRHCAVCNEQLHHIITIDPVPRELMLSVQRIVIATCLSCLGQQELFFIHDAQGEPRELGEEREKPKRIEQHFEETTVQLAPTAQRWKWQDWALSNGRENLHRVGGYPCAHFLRCPQCKSEMVLLMQVSSDIPQADGQPFMWGDSGICYIQWCDTCKISGQIWQCA